MGDDATEVTEEMMDQANDKRGEAQAAMSDGDFARALDIFTEAILLNPTSASFYAKRASVFYKMKRAYACIHDCDKAISLNPDCAIAYKWRGMSWRSVLYYFRFLFIVR